MEILIDTREQKPFVFANETLTGLHRTKLDAGDYSIVGYDKPTDKHSIIIERKANCSEYSSNLGKNFERFEREAQKLAEYKHRAIIVCGPDNFQYLYDQKFIGLHPKYAYNRIAYLWIQYGIPTFFHDTPEQAEMFMMRLFKRVYEINNE